jgi:hypothetical protein
MPHRLYELQELVDSFANVKHDSEASSSPYFITAYSQGIEESNNPHKGVATSRDERAEQAEEEVEFAYDEAESISTAQVCSARQILELQFTSKKASTSNERRGRKAPIISAADAKSGTRPLHSAYSLYPCRQLPTSKEFPSLSNDFDESTQTRYTKVDYRKQDTTTTISMAQTGGEIISSDRPVILKNICSKENTRLVIVSTASASLSAENITVEAEGGVIMGQMSDETAQKISADHNTLSVENRDIPPTQASRSFFGTGRSLTESRSMIQAKADSLA